MERKPDSLRPHIVLYGAVNAGKSSLMNALTAQETSIVSDAAGTTTDAVSKAMELLPFGPVVFVDTAGLDDQTELGAKRAVKTAAALAGAEIKTAVADARYPIPEFFDRTPPTVFVLTRRDEVSEELIASRMEEIRKRFPAAAAVAVSSVTGVGIEELKQILISVLEEKRRNEPILMEGLTEKDKIFVLVCPIDSFVLVCPIDSEAPAGRLILPQVQTVRRILDTYGVAVVVQPPQLTKTLALLGSRVGLVIADSQVIGDCAQMVPETIPLTTFSILFSAWRGDIRTYILNAKILDSIRDDDAILIAEACTHQVPSSLRRHRPRQTAGNDSALYRKKSKDRRLRRRLSKRRLSLQADYSLRRLSDDGGADAQSDSGGDQFVRSDYQLRNRNCAHAGNFRTCFANI